MKRAAPVTLLLLLAAAADIGAQPTAFHRRVESGWTYITVSVPANDYTVCVVNPPKAPLLDDAATTVQARSLSGHLQLRSDASRLDTAFRAVVGAASGEGRARWSPARVPTAAERHLLVLAGGAGAPHSGAVRGAPVLLAAGNRPAVELMEELLSLSNALPDPEPVEPTDPAIAMEGWWRHLDGESETASWVGFATVEREPRDVATLRILSRALSVRLDRRGWFGRIDEVAVPDGRIRWFEVPLPPDSIRAAAAVVRGIFDELRRSPLTVAEFEAHRQYFRDRRLAALRKPDRWFPDVLGAELAGGLPATAFERDRVWKKLTPEQVRERAVVLLPADLVLVSEGRRPESRDGLTELWPEPDVHRARDLTDAARADLTASVVERLRAILPDTTLHFTVVSDWTWLRDRASLTGRLEESLDLDRLEEAFYPLDGGIAFHAWVSPDGVGASMMGHPRELQREDQIRLEGRFWSDPWRLAALLEGAERLETDYGGGTQIEGRVFQLVTLRGPGVSISVLADPQLGRPRRVLVNRSDVALTLAYHLFDYATWDGGGVYPRRIERLEGIRRVSVRRVRSVTRASRLATMDGLR